MKVQDIMYKSLIVTLHDETVDHAAKRMDAEGIGSILVQVDGQIKGLVTSRDIMRKVVVPGLRAHDVSVGDIMSTPLITIEGDSYLEEAADLMSQKNIRRLVVTTHGRVVGVISLKLIGKNLRFLQNREFIQHHLNDSVAAAHRRD